MIGSGHHVAIVRSSALPMSLTASCTRRIMLNVGTTPSDDSRRADDADAVASDCAYVDAAPDEGDDWPFGPSDLDIAPRLVLFGGFGLPLIVVSMVIGVGLMWVLGDGAYIAPDPMLHDDIAVPATADASARPGPAPRAAGFRDTARRVEDRRGSTNPVSATSSVEPPLIPERAEVDPAPSIRASSREPAPSRSPASETRPLAASMARDTRAGIAGLQSRNVSTPKVPVTSTSRQAPLRVAIPPAHSRPRAEATRIVADTRGATNVAANSAPVRKLETPVPRAAVDTPVIRSAPPSSVPPSSTSLSPAAPAPLRPSPPTPSTSSTADAVPAPVRAAAPDAPAAAGALHTAANAGASTTSRVADEELINTTLRRYASAYEQLDADAAQAVWPTVDARALARAFQGLESQDIKFTRCDVTVSLLGGSASAACQGWATYVPRIGNKDARTVSRRWTFQLRKVQDSWVISKAASN